MRERHMSGHHRRLIGSLILLLVAAVSFFLLEVAAPKAAAAKKPRTLLIGIEPEHNIFDQVQQYRMLTEYLSERLGVEVKLTIMSRYGEVVKRFRSMHLDGAILSSYTAALAINDLGLKPIATLVDQDGKSESRGYIFVRNDSGINSVADMKGKRVVYVDPATMEGYLFAKGFFHQNGVDAPDTFFGLQYFSGSHASALYAVLDGRADVGAAKAAVYDQLVKRDGSIGQELKILAESPPVPEVTLCLKDDLDPRLLEELQRSILDMGQTAQGHKVLKEIGASRFTPASPEDFAVVSQLEKEARIEGGTDGKN